MSIAGDAPGSSSSSVGAACSFERVGLTSVVYLPKRFWQRRLQRKSAKLQWSKDYYLTF
jgi:hypothetical protein